MSHELASLITIASLIIGWRVFRRFCVDTSDTKRDTRSELHAYALSMAKRGHSYRCILNWTLRKNGSYKTNALTRKEVIEILEGVPIKQ